MKYKYLGYTLSCLLLICLLIGCNKRALTPGEGYIDVDGGKVWYRINGSGTKTPVLVLHGGPGSSSYGLDPLKALSKDRPVIFYDQLGCGRSTRITDTTLMTIDHYADELEQVRRALYLEDFYLYGQSWGPALGLEYYLKYPKEVKAIIFSSPLFSTQRWIKDADTLIATLPDSIQVIIRENEKNKTFDTDSYQSAVKIYYSKFLSRHPRPQPQADSAEMFFGKNVYEFMWGPSEFTATGNLLNYDRVNRLNEVRVPTLLLTGEYDEARPSTVNYFHGLIPDSEFTIIKNSGHATVRDNPEQTIARINEFLQKNDER